MVRHPAVSTQAPERTKRAQRFLWGAIFCGFIYSSARTASDVQAASLGIYDVVRGGGPVVLLGLGVVAAKPLRKQAGVVEWGIGLFLAVAVVSAAWSVDARVTFLKAVPLMACYLAAMRLVRLYPDAQSAIRGLAAVVHGLLILAAVEFAVVPGLVFAPVGAYSSERRLSMLAPQISSNPLALLAVVGILGVLLRVGPAWISRHVLVQVALVAVYLGELLATRTRIGLAIGVLLVVGALVAQVNRRPVLVVNAVLVAIAAALWAWTPERVAAIESFLARGQDASTMQTLTGRTVLWDIALTRWQEDPLLGFGYFAGQRLGLVGVSEQQSNIDSTWIELLVGVGLLGMVPLAVAVVVGLCRLPRIDAPRPDTLWIVGVGVAALVVSFVNPTLQGPSAGMVLLAFPVLLGGVFSEPSTRKPGIRRSHRPSRHAGPTSAPRQPVPSARSRAPRQTLPRVR